MTLGEPLWVGLSLMPEEAFREAALPLFAAGQVEALEWSFDMGWGVRLPLWLDGLLAHYAAEGRLFGHGVHYSLLSAQWEDRQARWLGELERELRERCYVHVSEHFGFMTAGPYVRGAPLPAPRGRALQRVGRDRLQRLRQRALCPVGLENLALAFSREEALGHGAFLESLLSEQDFILLDLHNLYCQVENFSLDPIELLSTFALSRVRELHVSGGSFLPAWPATAHDRVRCDTHDDGIPEPVFALLSSALARCPNVRVVVFEQLGHTLVTPASVERFQADFRRVREIVSQEAARRSHETSARDATEPSSFTLPLLESCADEGALATFQSAFLTLLMQRPTCEEAQRCLLQHESFAPFRAELVSIDPRALGIAARVVRKWARTR